MKQSELIVLGLAGLAVFMILKGRAATGPTVKAGGPGGTANLTGGTREILDSRGLPFDNGWRYYSDGTSIGPDGAYYLNGQMIWKP